MEKSIKKKKQTQRSTTAVVDGKHEERRVYYCTRCPRSFTKQSGNFAKAKSPLWYHNNMYLPVCNKCLEELYKPLCGSPEKRSGSYPPSLHEV